jgi:hypothetical protein
MPRGVGMKPIKQLQVLIYCITCLCSSYEHAIIYSKLGSSKSDHLFKCILHVYVAFL